MSAKLRQAPVYVLHDVYKRPALRQLPVYILHGLLPLPKNIDGFTNLVNTILAASNMPLTTEDVTFGPPEPTTEHDCNTKVLVTSIKSWVKGSMYFYYTRVGLHRMNLASTFNPGAAASVHAMLPAVRNATKLALSADEFVDDPIVSGKVLLKATANSYFFLPGATLQIG